jgi:hypothetical protein
MDKTLRWIGRCAAAVVALYFLFGHFADAEETSKRAKSNELIVKELAAIRLNQATKEQATSERDRELCIAGKLRDIDDCAAVGVEVRE